jgi:hypothetical protein
MKSSHKNLRALIKEILLAEYGQAASASGSDPTDPKGFYSYELTRGNDIQGFWYRSPARSMGSDGDPGRPSDALDYIGMSAKTATSEEGGEEAPEETPEETPDYLNASSAR